MPLSVGDKLGPYEILAPIGAGGMGEVYKANDTRLDRIVAIKVSKTEFSERFEREARVISALNHPHICQLYDVGPNYLVMEYVDGVPLRGPLPLDQALKYAVQTCEALDGAHKKNITHRDLKPANILTTKQGIKLLDFGLAKVGPAVRADEATVTMALTDEGQILGTLLYMAPEQINGQEADARSDIFSFGLALYEMLTGKRAFEGSTPASVMGAIMERPAPSIATIAPPALDRLLQRCLAKDPDDRWQSARDLKAELEWIAAAPEPGSAAPTVPSLRHRAWLPWSIAAFLLLGLMPATILHFRPTQPVDRPLVRLDVDLGADVSLPAPTSGGSSVAISSDGTRLAYVSGTPIKLFTRRLDQPKATELPGTQGAIGPFFSPDGQWVGFVADGKLNKISVEGGAVVPLGDITIGNFAGASWGEDGSIIESEAFTRGLLRFPPGGGPPETIVGLSNGEQALPHPQILPGSKAILFAAGTTAIWIRTPSRSSGSQIAIGRSWLKGANRPRYLATSNGMSDRVGHLIYVNQATLFAIPFDLEKLETRGTAVPILDDVAYNRARGVGQFDVALGPSGHGTLVYRRVTGGGPSGMMMLEWVGPTGKRAPLPGNPGDYRSPSLSPDGNRVALTVTEGGNPDVWVYDPQRDTMTRLTFGGGAYYFPTWSPDGQYVVFESVGNGIFQARADGAGQPEALTESKTTQVPGSFTPDGKRLTYLEGSANRQIWTVSVEDHGGQLKAGQPEQFLKSGFNDRAPSFSPDGRWLAYHSNESGKNEVYVRAFPPPASRQGGKWQVSNSGGTLPRWSRSGHDLLYQSGDQIMVASYSAKGDTFVAEKPRVWIAKLGTIRDWDVAPDGKRVIVLTPVESAEAPKQEHEVVFLENFFDYLRQRVPLGK